MTAPQPATPGSDSVRAQMAEVCTCGHGRDEHDDGTAHCGANEWCNCNAFVPVCAEPMRGGPNSGLPCDLPRGHNGGIHNRPAAPSEPPAGAHTNCGNCEGIDPGSCINEPPAETQQDPEYLAWLKAGRPPIVPAPAETQQDDERVTRGVARALWTQRLAHDPSVRERTAFLAGWDAALAARPSADTETLADQFMSRALDNIGAFDGSNNEARDRAYVRAELIALLDGLR